MTSEPMRLVTMAAAFCVAAFFGTTSAEAARQPRSCDVDQVGVMENRIHIKCVPIEGQANTQAIYYFAMSLSEDSRKVDNVIALAIAAKQTRKPLVIAYDTADYKSVPGCDGSNCRRLLAAALE